MYCKGIKFYKNCNYQCMGSICPVNSCIYNLNIYGKHTDNLDCVFGCHADCRNFFLDWFDSYGN